MYRIVSVLLVVILGGLCYKQHKTINDLENNIVDLQQQLSISRQIGVINDYALKTKRQNDAAKLEKYETYHEKVNNPLETDDWYSAPISESINDVLRNATRETH